MLIGAIVVAWPTEEWRLIHDSWDMLSWFAQSVLLLLDVMLVYTLATVLDRTIRYWSARRQTRIFVSTMGKSLLAGRFEEVILLAEKCGESHLANVVAAGVRAYVSVDMETDTSIAVELANHAMQRTRAAAFAALNIGQATLACISATAPFLGLLGTVVGILNSFGSVGAARSAVLGWIARGLSDALVTTAAGMVVAISSVWFRNHLQRRIELLDLEMKNTASELLSYLKMKKPPRVRPIRSDLKRRDEFGWEIAFDPQRVLLASLVLFFLYTLYYATQGISFH